MIGHHLATSAARFPQATAVAYAGRRYTYAALNERSCRLAHALRALGVCHGTRVAVLLRNCNAFVEAYFAAAKLGAVFVPINFRLTAREIGGILDTCTPEVLLHALELAAVVDELARRPSLPRHRVPVDDRPAGTHGEASDDYERWLRAHPADEPDTLVSTDDLQVLMHSSGTTGQPKGAMLTHGTTLASCAAKIIDFSLTPSDTSVVFGPLFHAGPLMDLAVPLWLRGGTVIVGASGNFDPLRLLRTIAEEHATVVPVYPAMLRQVLAAGDADRYDLSCWRLLVTGGEPVPMPVLRAICAHFPGLGFINNYGSTEGGPITTFLAPDEHLRKMGSVGKPAFGVAVRIAGDDDRPLPPGEVGEVLVRSPFVCRGYWNRPDWTAESLRNGWWHTGDLAWRDDEGYLWIAGRKKDMIKSGTENVYPIEIEQVIAALPGVVETAVIGVPDAEWGETPAAYVVRDPRFQLDADAVIAHCRQHLASYKKPRHVRFVDALPRNNTNKVSKALLRAQFAANRE